MRRLFEGGAYWRAVPIGGRRLVKHCTRQIYFFYIFIQRYTLYLLIFPWTDTKLIVKIQAVRKTREFHDNESENISSESMGGAALIRGRRLLTFLSQMRFRVSLKTPQIFQEHTCGNRWDCPASLRIISSIHLSTTLKEGGVGTRSLIFLSEKLLYFFLGLCDYSD